MPELGPFCQSCSMPLQTPEDFGTDDQKFRVNDYCRFCYQDGKFAQPDITVDEMIDRGSQMLAGKQIMSAQDARVMLEKRLPLMKRWQAPAPVIGAEGRGFTAGDELC